MAASPQTVAPGEAGVPRNPVATNMPPINEVTVRFRRWHAFGPTAYMRGQEAGFSPAEAEKLQRLGIGIIVHDRRIAVADGPPMVRK